VIVPTQSAKEGPKLRSIAPETSATSARFLAGGGELGALMRAFDWAATPLGPPERWPQSLKTAVRIMLTSRQPFWIGWGDELTKLYNDPYKSIIGGKHPWALGRPASEVWREIWSAIEPMLATAMQGEEGTYVEQQLLIMERNGYPEETYFTFSYSPIPDDDGSPGGIICANTDDTQRVIGERQIALLRELAARANTARSWREACALSAASFAADPRDLPFATIHMLDRESERLTLAAAHGIAPWRPAAPAQLEADHPSAAALRSGEPQLIADARERYADLPSGAWSEPPHQILVLPIPAAGERGRAGVLTVGLNPYRKFDDVYRGFLELVCGQIASAIANAEAYEDERRRAEALAELDRAKTAFFSNVSHEFRTPLTLMLGPLEEALANPDDAVAMAAHVEVARRSGRRLLKLVNTLLDFSRIEAGRADARFRPTDLGQIVADLASSFRSATERAGLRLTVRAAPLERVWIDQVMLEKIVLNLISNAFKFTLEGGITVDVGPGAAPRTAEIVVVDTGVGIPAHEISRLFERFHRVQGAKGRSFEGSGIGLALVQELVQLHRGAIEVESHEGEGSTFRIVLPLGHAHLPADHLEPADGAAAGAAATAARAFVEEALRWLPDAPVAGEPALDAAPAGRRPTVLLADDNGDMREYVARLLGGAGFDVVAVGDGEAALSGMREARPDLVLTDVMMPGLDGFGLLGAIRGDPALADLPVIMLSARAGEESAVEGLAAGADDYLGKPFSARELIARVSANLALAQARREGAAERQAAQRQLEALNATLERRVSEALAERKVLAEVVEGGHALVQVVDLDFRWMALNGAAAAGFARFFGVTPRVGDSVLSTLVDEPRYSAGLEALWRRALAGEAFTSTVDLVDPAGERCCYEMKFSALRDATGARIGAVQFAYDVTERVLEQERLALAEEQLRQSQKMEAMGQLTGGVAHDFNNLLTPIIGGLDMLRRAELGGEREQRLIDGALQSADRAKTLVQRLLAFARRQPLQPTAVDLGALVTGMADLVASTAGPQIRVAVEVADDLASAKADPNQLEMALLNLAVNARDAMPNGGAIRISVSNAVVRAGERSDLTPGAYVRLSVADTGVGMDSAVLERAIEPFFSTKGIGKGTGLGLSMVHGLVQQLGGAMTLKSRPGLGTNVELWLPRSREPPAAGERPAAGMESAVRKGVALLVDDEELVRASTTDMLVELGYEVEAVASAEDGLRRLESGLRPAVVISDHLMPGVSGVDLARTVGARFPGTPVLIISGYADMEGIDPHLPRLTKPFLASDLSAALAAMV
jgi:signal transduction histidine kinase